MNSCSIDLHTVFIFVRWVPLAGFILFYFFLFKDWQHQPSKKYSVQYYGNENTSVKYSIDIFWHLYVYLVCVLLWMPVAHVRFKPLRLVRADGGGSQHSCSVFNHIQQRISSVSSHNHPDNTLSLSHTLTHDDTHIHTESISQLSPVQTPPPPGPQHLLFHKPQQDSNSVPVHLYICVCVWKRTCVHP